MLRHVPYNLAFVTQLDRLVGDGRKHVPPSICRLAEGPRLFSLVTLHWSLVYSPAMQRPSLLMMLVILLLGILVIREPRFARLEENFLRWLLHNSGTRGANVPLTVVEIGRDRLLEQKDDPDKAATEAFLRRGGTAVSPLEYALFLQSVLDFQPTVVAVENILRWRERDKPQEQVFLDQAMRVPKLLLASEMTTTPDPDAPGSEIQGFTQVKGKRGDLVEFTGVTRQPDEDLRLISTAGFINLPEESSDYLHVPLLFRYRGEVVPSFALQAILMWLRATPAEVKIELGSHILLPNGKQIPIRSDGTMLVNPNALHASRRMSLNELLLAAQQRSKTGTTKSNLEGMREHIVLARTPRNPLSPPDVFAPTIATIQSDSYIHRVGWSFDVVVIILAMVAVGFLSRFSRLDLFLGGLALTAAYCLIALGIFSRWLLWLPGYLPLGAVWLLVLLGIFYPRPPREVVPPSEAAAAG